MQGTSQTLSRGFVHWWILPGSRFDKWICQFATCLPEGRHTHYLCAILTGLVYASLSQNWFLVKWCHFQCFTLWSLVQVCRAKQELSHAKLFVGPLCSITPLCDQTDPFLALSLCFLLVISNNAPFPVSWLSCVMFTLLRESFWVRPLF